MRADTLAETRHLLSRAALRARVLPLAGGRAGMASD